MMTKEEAIKCLTSLLEIRRKYCDMQTMKDEIEALDMAIGALEGSKEFMKVTFDRDQLQEMVEEAKREIQMEIEALKQEPCEDAISRQAVLKPYQTLKDNDTICIWLLRKNIEQQPPVTPKQRWIPVSERLPEEDKDVLITYRYSGKRVVTMAYKESNGWRFENDGWIPLELVIAWMPLPEPYKAENKTKQGLAYADQDTLIPAT